MRRFRIALFSLLAASLLGGGASPSKARSWPWFLVIHGGGLANPVVVRGRPNDMHSDAVRLSDALRGDSIGKVPRPTVRHYDVTEFWGPAWIPDSAGQPFRPLRLEQGSRAGTLYVSTSTNPVVWVRHSNGFDEFPRRVGDEGVKILQKAGLPLR